MTARRVTPTGILVSTAASETAEWFAVRRDGITATDIPKILGLSQYGNARTVYENKLGHLADDEAGEPARWGTLLEDVVAREWASRTQNPVRRVGIVANAARPWIRASCDRRLVGQNAALEVKTRSAYVAGAWRDGIPDDVLAQVAWQRIATGFHRIHVACLIGGQRLIDFLYEQDADVERYVMEQAEKVWQHVQDGVPPHVEPDQLLLDMLNRLYPDRSGDRDLTSDSQVVDLHRAQLDTARRQRAAAEKAETAAKAALVQLLGDGQVALVDGEFAYAYPERTRTTKAREATTATYRQLTFTPPKEAAA